MKLVTFTAGDGDEEKVIGKAWFCVNDDRDKADYCDECEDYLEEPEQLPLFQE